MNELKTKDTIRKRDDFRCVQCGETNAAHVERTGRVLDVHRTVPGSEYSTAKGVCSTLCRRCHKGAHVAMRPPAKTKAGKYINARIDPVLEVALKAYLGNQRPPLSTASVVEVALEDFLRSTGYLPLQNEE